MKNNQSTQRLQREFLFVFDLKKKSSINTREGSSAQDSCHDNSYDFDEEKVNALRKSLISELNEFGC